MEDLLIVAAGMGTRLRAKGDLKPLVELKGTPLIIRACESAFAAGLKRATVVTGYNAPILTDFLQQTARARGWTIQTVLNPDYQQPNGLSVLAARHVLSGPFCLAMCDHLVEPALYTALLAHPRALGQLLLGVDKDMTNPHVDLDDVTKVQLDGTHIQQIDKTLTRYNAFDTGVFAADTSFFDALQESGQLDGDFSISGGVRRLAARNKAFGADVTGKLWIDVDSPEMHDMASVWLDQHPAT